MPLDRIDSVVIGAGQAGLSVSRELGGRGIEHLVLEQGRVGETWRSRRWDAFASQQPGLRPHRRLRRPSRVS
jgi:putative flavoprotein involved in K+ transport